MLLDMKSLANDDSPRSAHKRPTRPSRRIAADTYRWAEFTRREPLWAPRTEVREGQDATALTHEFPLVVEHGSVRFDGWNAPAVDTHQIGRWPLT